MISQSLSCDSRKWSILVRIISELSCRSRIATLSDKVSLLERKVEFLEARVSSYVALPGHNDYFILSLVVVLEFIMKKRIASFFISL